ncbi:MAG: DUF86 domain-containing protein [Rhodoferax sp.]|nr:DUF86 domain-containing protein [Rhodoferax sp.]
MSDKSRRVSDWLADIRESIANIYSDMGSLTKQEFTADGKTQRAVIKGLTDIGEASKMIMELDASLGEKNPQMWQHFKDVYAMRIRLTHLYHRVNLSVVYDTVQVHLPVFEALLGSIAQAEAPPDGDSQLPQD